MPAPSMFAEGKDYEPALWRIPYPEFLASPTIAVYMWMIQWGSEYDYIVPTSGDSNFWAQATKGTVESVVPEYFHIHKGHHLIGKYFNPLISSTLQVSWNRKIYPELMPIVQSYEEKGKKAYRQSGKYTTATAKRLARLYFKLQKNFKGEGDMTDAQTSAEGISPKKIDHFVKNSFGTPGRLIMSIEDRVAGKDVKLKAPPYHRKLEEFFMLSTIFTDFYDKQEYMATQKEVLLNDTDMMVDMADYNTEEEANKANMKAHFQAIARTNATAYMTNKAAEMLVNVRNYLQIPESEDDTRTERNPTLQMSRDIWNYLSEVNEFSGHVDTGMSFPEVYKKVHNLVERANKISSDHTGKEIKNNLERTIDTSSDNFNKMLELDKLEEKFGLTRKQAKAVHDLANPKVGKELMKLIE